MEKLGKKWINKGSYPPEYVNADKPYDGNPVEQKKEEKHVVFEEIKAKPAENPQPIKVEEKKEIPVNRKKK